MHGWRARLELHFDDEITMRNMTRSIQSRCDRVYKFKTQDWASSRNYLNIWSDRIYNDGDHFNFIEPLTRSTSNSLYVCLLPKLASLASNKAWTLAINWLPWRAVVHPVHPLDDRLLVATSSAVTRSLKLRHVERGQYLDGWPSGEDRTPWSCVRLSVWTLICERPSKYSISRQWNTHSPDVSQYCLCQWAVCNSLKQHYWKYILHIYYITGNRILVSVMRRRRLQNTTHVG